jgi:signal transduction histidine kinase
MRERAELIDAELQIESRLTPPNRGTLVQLILPAPVPEA